MKLLVYIIFEKSKRIYEILIYYTDNRDLFKIFNLIPFLCGTNKINYNVQTSVGIIF